MHYKLTEDKQVVPCTMEEWAEQFESMDGRRVALTETVSVSVSTVFLGLDHQYGAGPPLLFETMVFPKEVDTPLKHEDGSVTLIRAPAGEMERYSTWEEAEEGHKRIVDKYKTGM